MKILVAHNAYQQRGGEDAVVESEISLLRSHGHEVRTYFFSNNNIPNISYSTLAVQTIWSRQTYANLNKIFQSFRPDIIHVHNTLPLISPSIYWAAHQARVPLVQTLHNFRLNCLNALYFREGKVCEDCLGSMPWRGVVRKCYRGSVAASAVLSGMLILHRVLRTYHNKVSRYIALNNFCKNKFIQGGLPADLIAVKPNFVNAPPLVKMPRNGILFVGRLSKEKGIESLIKASSLMPEPQLRVVGDGPQSTLLDGVYGVTRLGALSADMVRLEMISTLALVVPSVWYENFPRIIVEAFAAGLPVIASRIGALAEIVTDGETGIFFEPGNAQDMADKLSWALSHSKQMAEMGVKARAKYEAEFTPDHNYKQLLTIYEDVINK